MSTVYVGNGTVPSPQVGASTRFAIQSSTNASPIVLQTQSAHTVLSGDTIEVEGHLVNTNANGVWAASVIDSTHIALTGSTGNGVGAATGYITDYQVNPAATIPSDGDLISAASVNVPLEAQQNFQPWAYRLAGRYRLVNEYYADWSASGATWATATASSTSYSTINVGGSPTPGIFGSASGTNPPPPAIQANDIFDYTLNIQGICNTAIQFNNVQLFFSRNGGAYSTIGGGSATFSSVAIVGVSIAARVTMPAASWWDVALAINSSSGSAATFQGLGAGNLVIRHLRAN